MRLAALLMAVPLLAAEPDWQKVEPHALDFLQRYVRIPTVNPPADTRAAAALFKQELEAAGLEPTIYTSGAEGQTVLLVRLKGRDSSKKPLLLMNHLDVVPVDRSAWSVDPFAALIRDGQLWGRGALDMKSVGVQQLMALIEMKRTGTVPPRDIVMLVNPDEETSGERGIKWMIANHLAEFDPEYVLDEGGMGTRDVFAPGKLVFGIPVGEKQFLWLKLKARGTAGHGSQPIADNANMILLQAIQKALDLPRPAKQNAVVAELERTLSGQISPNKFTDSIRANTVSLTTLQAGVGSPVKVNVIPSSSEATLDCRLLPGVNAEEFLSEMKARINDPRVTVEKINSSADTGTSTPDTALYRTLKAAVLKAHPDAVVTPILVPYSTDSAPLRKRGIVAYGFTPMILDLATVATMHSDEERIPVAEFLEGIRIYFDVLRG